MVNLRVHGSTIHLMAALPIHHSVATPGFEMWGGEQKLNLVDSERHRQDVADEKTCSMVGDRWPGEGSKRRGCPLSFEKFLKN